MHSYLVYPDKEEVSCTVIQTRKRQREKVELRTCTSCMLMVLYLRGQCQVGLLAPGLGSWSKRSPHRPTHSLWLGSGRTGGSGASSGHPQARIQNQLGFDGLPDCSPPQQRCSVAARRNLFSLVGLLPQAAAHLAYSAMPLSKTTHVMVTSLWMSDSRSQDMAPEFLMNCSCYFVCMTPSAAHIQCRCIGALRQRSSLL